MLDATKVGPGCWRGAGQSWCNKFPPQYTYSTKKLSLSRALFCRTRYTLNSKMSEDCLTLDIFAPKANKLGGRLVPIMVWIYGGGYITGAGDDLQTRGNRLVQRYQDVVVVSLNYRLGPLGWLGSAELRHKAYTETGMNVTGNAGHLSLPALIPSAPCPTRLTRTRPQACLTCRWRCAFCSRTPRRSVETLAM